MPPADSSPSPEDVARAEKVTVEILSWVPCARNETDSKLIQAILTRALSDVRRTGAVEALTRLCANVQRIDAEDVEREIARLKGEVKG